MLLFPIFEMNPSGALLDACKWLKLEFAKFEKYEYFLVELFMEGTRIEIYKDCFSFQFVNYILI